MQNLNDFANKYPVRGEKMIAAAVYSMLNDKYFGQWLVLRKPFRKMEEFQEKHPDVIEKIPLRYRNFALAVKCAPEYWNDDEEIISDMELEANGQAHIPAAPYGAAGDEAEYALNATFEMRLASTRVGTTRSHRARSTAECFSRL